MIGGAYLNFLLILIPCLALVPIGRLFKIRGFFTASLVGLSAVSLVVAVLANFSAGLIRPVVLLAVLLGLVLLVRQLGKVNIGKNYWLYLILVALGALIFIFNNPIKVFIHNQVVLFDSHYSYYSSQAAEMLNAKYFSRLQVAQALPVEWSRYHFFNASTQAVVQGLVLHPNLFSYFFAQLIISILAILVILENLFLHFKLSIKTLLVALAWLIFGFTIFANSIAWNLMTTGTLTVPALVLMIFAAYRRDRNLFIIFTLVFGASAFRLLPLALLALLALAVYLYRKSAAGAFASRFLDTIKKMIPNLQFLLLYLFFVLYNFFTLIFGSPTAESQMSLGNANLYYHDGWIYVLSSYKVAGLLAHLKAGTTLFPSYDKLEYVKTGLDLTLVVAIMAALFICLGVLYVRFALNCAKNTFTRAILLSCALLPLAILFLPAALKLRFLLALTLPYLIIVFTLINFIVQDRKDKISFIIFYGALFVGALAFQFSPLAIEVKAPLLFAVCDVGLWGILAIFMFARTKGYSQAVFFLVLSLLMVPIFSFHLQGMLAIDAKTPIEAKKALSADFKRTDFVLPHSNLCRFDLENPVQTDGQSALIGCDLKYSPKYNDFISYDFIEKPAN